MEIKEWINHDCCVYYWEVTGPLQWLLLETGLSRWLSGKRIQCRRLKGCGFHPGLRRSPGVGNGKPLQCSCLENSMGRSLAGYSPWGCRVRHDRSCMHTLPFTLREMNPLGYLREGVPGRGTGGTKGAERNVC